MTELKLYSFEELSEDSQENAIKNNSDINAYFGNWYNSVYYDIYHIAEIIGIKIKDIGFNLQRDEVQLEGEYRYKKNCLKNIKQQYPFDTKLHTIVQNLVDCQKKWQYDIIVDIEHSEQFWVCNSQSKLHRHDAESEITEILKDFIQYIYSRLESEYNYLTSDTEIKKSLITHEYTFTEDGKIC